MARHVFLEQIIRHCGVRLLNSATPNVPRACDLGYYVCIAAAGPCLIVTFPKSTRKRTKMLQIIIIIVCTRSRGTQSTPFSQVQLVFCLHSASHKLHKGPSVAGLFIAHCGDEKHPSETKKCTGPALVRYTPRKSYHDFLKPSQSEVSTLAGSAATISV